MSWRDALGDRKAGFRPVNSYFESFCRLKDICSTPWLSTVEVAPNGHLLGRNDVAFAGSEEEIGLQAVLASIEVVIAPAQGEQFSVIAALHNEAVFDHQDLVGTADGGETVGDDEGGSSLHQLAQSSLDHGLGFGIERAGSLVEDEDSRLRQEGARNGGQYGRQRETAPQ